MALRGRIEARCPKGCAPFPTDVWSYVRGDLDAALREALLAGELNLIVCEGCGGLFYPEASVIYCDAPAGLLAFVLPESYRQEEAAWRAKLREDWERIRPALRSGLPVNAEPMVFFGMHALSELLRAEDELQDELRVAEAQAAELRLDFVAVDRAAARRDRLPWGLPSAGESWSRDAALRGLERLLEANGRLLGYKAWLERLRGGAPLPVPASAPDAR